MYLSETEVYKKFYAAVKERLGRVREGAEYDADIYSFVSEINGMVSMIEELTKEEEK